MTTDTASVERSADAPGPLSAAGCPLSETYDVALVDLDGVVYRGDGPVPHAARALDAARSGGMRLAFVTNNALRPPEAVVAKLAAAGVPATEDDVVTSAQAAARVLAERLPAGADVLVAGGDGLLLAVRAAGLHAVDSADVRPAAVVQGYDPTITYARLAEAALAIRAGALWVASNTDATVPAERGLLPGAGSLVAALRTATGQDPIVAGKPELALHEESVRRTAARLPLIVGDRLDTDIEAGTRSGTATLLVLTGVTSASDLLRAPARWRPTFLAADLRGLHRTATATVLTGVGAAACGAWTATVRHGLLAWGSGRPDATGDGLDALRAACAAAWSSADAGLPVTAVAGDPPPGCADLT